MLQKKKLLESNKQEKKRRWNSIHKLIKSSKQLLSFALFLLITSKLLRFQAAFTWIHPVGNYFLWLFRHHTTALWLLAVGLRKGIIKEVYAVQVHCKCAALQLMSWNPSDMFYIHVMYIKLNILVTHHTTGIISAQFVLDDDTLFYVVNTDTQYYHLMCWYG